MPDTPDIETVTETGPTYGIDLPDRIPIGGGMYQQMATRDDLQRTRDASPRTASAYEVLVEMYREQAARIAALEDEVAKLHGRELYYNRVECESNPGWWRPHGSHAETMNRLVALHRWEPHPDKPGLYRPVAGREGADA